MFSGPDIRRDPEIASGLNIHLLSSLPSLLPDSIPRSSTDTLFCGTTLRLGMEQTPYETHVIRPITAADIGYPCPAPFTCPLTPGLTGRDCVIRTKSAGEYILLFTLALNDSDYFFIAAMKDKADMYASPGLPSADVESIYPLFKPQS